MTRSAARSAQLLTVVAALVPVVGVCILAATPAHASGFHLSRFGGIFGHPNADGGIALYWNPSRIVPEEAGFFGAADVTLVIRDASFDRVSDTEYRSEAEREANTGTNTVGANGFLPYFAVGGGGPIGPITLAGGLGVVPGFGGVSAWDKDFGAPPQFPGAIDGPQRWNSISSSTLFIEYTAGAAVGIPDLGLRFGLTAKLVGGDIQSFQATNLNGSDAVVDSEGNLQEGRIYLKASDTAFGVGAGFSYDWSGGSASASYHSAYTMKLVGEVNQVFGTSEPTSVEAEVTVPLPHVFRTALTLDFGRVSVTGVTNYTTWSRVDANDVIKVDTGDALRSVPRNMDDTLSLRGVLGFDVTERLELAASAGFDPSAIGTQTISPGLSDADKIYAGLGGRWDAPGPIEVLFSYAHEFYETVEATDNIQRPQMNGTYKDTRGYLNVSLGLEL